MKPITAKCKSRFCEAVSVCGVKEIEIGMVDTRFVFVCLLMGYGGPFMPQWLEDGSVDLTGVSLLKLWGMKERYGTFL